MRTKTLILTAALSAAGVATSMAQAVYSVNAVGYVNTTLTPGLNLISNPLDAADNSIKALFTGVPNNFRVYKFNGTTYDITTFSTILGAWNPDSVASTALDPGQGAFVRNPGTANMTVTFVGEVPQGSLSTPLPAGLSIVASQVPQQGTLSTLGYTTPANNDRVFKWTGTGYNAHTYSTILNAWNPSEPSLNVGEAVFFRNPGTAKTWNRTFSVNP